ncbi:hypothetical protein PLEOSDRAFT_1106073 [Pleurotus ostreatus PC15]|uniref:Uncharacterized protein n=1 Tax=Pleurotus ostreatus (strain PC15) TaxID=1137138 RepID=A0A067NH44_PLEO1|nr:hypothetical protein PLEOSDRAFT_1106073 [Pleurotus ostreatus PC15]
MRGNLDISCSPYHRQALGIQREDLNKSNNSRHIPTPYFPPAACQPQTTTMMQNSRGNVSDPAWDSTQQRRKAREAPGTFATYREIVRWGRRRSTGECSGHAVERPQEPHTSAFTTRATPPLPSIPTATYDPQPP